MQIFDYLHINIILDTVMNKKNYDTLEKGRI